MSAPAAAKVATIASMQPLPIDDRTHLLVLTGAGISAESGIPTYRGYGQGDHGISAEERELLSTPRGLRAEPDRFWQYMSARRRELLSARPSIGHKLLAALEQRLGERFLLATQNVDGLHAVAGSRRLVELHGNLLRTRCSTCKRRPFADIAQRELAPLCELCTAAGRGDARHPPYLRPDVVLFGEHLAPQTLARIGGFIERARSQHLIYLAVGTSGMVFPAAELVSEVRHAGGESWLVNLGDAVNSDAFDHFLRGQSGELLPRLLAS